MRPTLTGSLVFLVMALLAVMLVATIARGEEPPPIRFDGPPAIRFETNHAMTARDRPTDGAFPKTHSHRCPFDGTVWSHGDDSYGNRAAHACPTCGRVTWQVWQRFVVTPARPAWSAPAPAP